MQALGKETLVIKSPRCRIPSDFVRTEYIEFDGNATTLKADISKFIDHLTAQGEHFEIQAKALGNNPIAQIDYLRRAFLLSGNKEFLVEAESAAQSVYSSLLLSGIVSAKSREGTWASLGMNPLG